MEPILQIKGLRKVYKEVVAVKDLHLTVNRGDIFGLLGPNGSGKTTTLGMLLGVLRPTKGEFSWFDSPIQHDNRKRIGSLLETPNFYPYMNAVDNLKITAAIKKMDKSIIDSRIEYVLKKVNLWERKKSKFQTFSLGMKQRLALAACLLSDPEVLVLDEPTNGLDPVGIIEIRELIQQIAAEGKTIIIASHILDEIEKICTDVAIMRKGELLHVSKLEEFMKQEYKLILRADDNLGLIAVLNELSIAESIEQVNNEVILVPKIGVTSREVNRLLFEKGIVLSGLREFHVSLEKKFIELIEDTKSL